MISSSALPLIQASVPLLREHGETITRHFYQSMFAAHPELKNIFNQGNQAQGEQQQALAGAVYAYAANIHQPEVLIPVLKRIAHKHASLGITPAQYTIVGKHLLAAIKDILGDIATDEIMAAWDEAYWLLASELIALEARLYLESEIKGANKWLTTQVVKKVQESEDVVSLYLTSDTPLPAFVPGQYVSVKMHLDELGVDQLRQYSLSDAPFADHWRISVKKESGTSATPAGLISNKLHQIEEGESLIVSPAYGDFQLLKGESPLILLSAGVGITPMISMLNTLSHSDPQRELHFAFATRSLNALPLASELTQAKATMSNLTSYLFSEHDEAGADTPYDHSFSGFMDLSRLSLPLGQSDIYLCGPLPFMRAQRRFLLDQGVEPERIHYEVFGPDLLSGLA